MKIPACALRVLMLSLLSLGVGVVAQPPAGGLVPDGLPMLRNYVPAKFPTGLPPNERAGSATLRIIVDETGAVKESRVLEASAPPFGEAALAALRQWTFAPGTAEGKPTAMCLDVPFEFFANAKPASSLTAPLHLQPRAATRTKAAVRDAPLGNYPKSLSGRGLPGEIVFRCRVGPDGRGTQLQIIEASHVDYAVAAIASFDQWTFSPAQQGDLPTAAELTGKVEYGETPAPTAARVLAANGLTGPDGQPPADRPLPLIVADPVWPYAQLLKGESGSASVEFTVLANGRTSDVRVREASDPEFGAALAAAVDTWVFRRAIANGRSVEVALVKTAEFKAPPAGSPDPIARLAQAAREDAIRGGVGLDERLTPIYRVAPAAPARWRDTDKSKGQAVIEFVIDQEGRARLPRIVSASEAEFGWAAATAVSQWIFKAPRRGGQPVDVRVQIPIQF